MSCRHRELHQCAHPVGAHCSKQHRSSRKRVALISAVPAGLIRWTLRRRARGWWTSLIDSRWGSPSCSRRLRAAAATAVASRARRPVSHPYHFTYPQMSCHSVGVRHEHFCLRDQVICCLRDQVVGAPEMWAVQRASAWDSACAALLPCCPPLSVDHSSASAISSAA